MKLIIYRLYDSSYGASGNPKTLSVSVKSDNTLSYSLYGGWQDSGIGFSMSNLGMQVSLPMSINKYKNTSALNNDIIICLASGYGSNKIKTFEMLNEIAQDKEIGMIHARLIGSFYRYCGDLIEEYKRGGEKQLQKIVGEDIFYNKNNLWYWKNHLITTMEENKLERLKNKVLSKLSFLKNKKKQNENN